MHARVYEYRHVIGFEETNLVGNVYYVNHLRWQGRCRELFLREYAPDVLDALQEDLALVTVRVTCEYLAELRAFDEIALRMQLQELRQNRLTLLFDYVRFEEGGESKVAQGEQVVACMHRGERGLIAAPVPHSLCEALRPYAPHG